MHILVPNTVSCHVLLLSGHVPSLLVSTMVVGITLTSVVCVLSKFCRMSLVAFAIPNG